MGEPGVGPEVTGEGVDFGTAPPPSAAASSGAADVVGRINGGTDTFSTGRVKGCTPAAGPPNRCGTAGGACRFGGGVTAGTTGVVPVSDGGTPFNPAMAVPDTGRSAAGPSPVAARAPPPRRLTAVAPLSARVSASSGVTVFPVPSARRGDSGPESSGRVPPSAMAARETALAAANAKRRPRQGERSASRATSCIRKAEPEAAPPRSTAVEPWVAGR